MISAVVCMTWSDLDSYIRAGLILLFGVVGIVFGIAEGSWGVFGLGLLGVAIGSGGIALTVWMNRNPVRPAPMSLFRRRSDRP